MKSEKVVIFGSKKFQVVSIPPTLALKYYFTLQKYVLGPTGEVLGQLLTTVEPDKNPTKEINKDAVIAKLLASIGEQIDLGSVLGKLAATIDPDILTELFKGLITNGVLKIDEKGQPVTFIFEEEFIGDITTLFGLVSEVVSHNYPNFFAMLLGLLNITKPASTLAH